ncbi:MAG TPA: glycine/betaine ABC transporter [Microbacterium sp.]|jgi:glycine betaine/proline transport system permease protein|uniref:ABC transporter permease n=1 Tax=Microbacterium TaxID=33882 RepID=UPI000C365BFE|nr:MULTISPECIES: proline/glycine betaine ABC transporter permease [Microbacterium]MBU21092.1 glycine/betaine ABC transporter [Microbacterium sp.]MCC4268811.1 proline/glycine betaine ABC transporter permease [Microbacterium schleiferi]HAJ16514.1 glycine/betaine ABC transporter [Microbacterium sp.]HAM12829.1 glycine/betaine ABC transporter [Microbacterium sp.]HBS09010.1 glycine/betaine ABC transporter [Microbacterium sp.]|tara:strand:- start:2674 stop:3630 length:957 start_codon:yes stop_codon:yes gene_type:complete
MDFRIPIGQWVETVVDWLRDNLSGLFDFITVVVRFLVDGLTDILLIIPIPAMIVVFALIGWLVRSWQMAVGTVLAFVFIIAMDLWIPTMQTLSLVLVATVVALAIAIPLGIWSARNDTVRTILKPVLDFMQTMPAFVYLIPAITFFSIGVVPGLVATVIFALPPGVRLTELGIRGVDSETVEAGQAFGATPSQILRGIQLPLATPTIMAGVNQVIMLALSMAVLAGIVGADGLGKIVVQSVSTVNLALGVEAGLGVVIIAVYLDRVTAALGNRADYPSSLRSVLARRRTARATVAAQSRDEDTQNHVGTEALQPTGSR